MEISRDLTIDIVGGIYHQIQTSIVNLMGQEYQRRLKIAKVPAATAETLHLHYTNLLTLIRAQYSASKNCDFVLKEILRHLRDLAPEPIVVRHILEEAYIDIVLEISLKTKSYVYNNKILDVFTHESVPFAGTVEAISATMTSAFIKKEFIDIAYNLFIEKLRQLI